MNELEARGKLITFEGGEGAGKSTVIAAAADFLREYNIDPLLTREPGGTSIGETIRRILLDPSSQGMCAETEVLMMFASRAQLISEKIEPNLRLGRWVVSDRFTDASFAYQGGGRGVSNDALLFLERFAAFGLQPDLTILLDVPVEQGMARVDQRGQKDRLESEPGAFFERVRNAYRERVFACPNRIAVIDASQALHDVIADVRDVLCARLGLI